MGRTGLAAAATGGGRSTVPESRHLSGCQCDCEDDNGRRSDDDHDVQGGWVRLIRVAGGMSDERSRTFGAFGVIRDERD